VIVTPQLFDQDRTVVVNNPYLLIQGKLQNQDNVISVKAERMQALLTRVLSSVLTTFIDFLQAGVFRAKT